MNIPVEGSTHDRRDWVTLMSDGEYVKRIVVDRENMPELYATNFHKPEFWEHLGRAVATYGFLEEVLKKAIFAHTATRRYSLEEVEAEFISWRKQMERVLTRQLVNLAEEYGKAARSNPETITQNVDELVDQIVAASEIRNVLCHGSWQKPDAEGKSIPLFVNRKMEIFETPVDITFLKQVQNHVNELAYCVRDTVTVIGLQFPGGGGPGRPIR